MSWSQLVVSLLTTYTAGSVETAQASSAALMEAMKVAFQFIMCKNEPSSASRITKVHQRMRPAKSALR